MSKDQEHKHPSYGMISFSRSFNGGAKRMFGSALTDHSTTISLRVSEAVWKHSLHEDRYYGKTNVSFVEVELTTTQFAELLVSMNLGDGVPCTIRKREYKEVPAPPEIPTEVERIKNTFDKELEGFVQAMRDRAGNVKELASKLPVKVQKQLDIELGCMIQQLEANIPFVLKQFHDASDRVVSSAKLEIESFALHSLTEAGQTALAAQTIKAKTLQAEAEAKQLPQTASEHDDK